MKTAEKKGDTGLCVTRRDFTVMAAMSAAAALTGCATDAITGKRYFMLTSESYEEQIDKESSPHQFSADYGAVQDQALNNYISKTGLALGAKSHRPNVPYSFRGVNAVYINAYTFPAGSIAVTRGMLLTMGSEAELAALLGHEIGHVVARHVGRQMTKGILFQSLTLVAAAVVAQQNEEYADLAAGLGMVGAGVFLAKYSRANEYEADALGLKYAAESGHNPQGGIDLMDTLVKISKSNPNAIERLFATHPMSAERYKKAVRDVDTKYAAMKSQPMGRDRYMDHTAGIRKQKTVIETLQNGERALARNNMNDAISHFRTALKSAPDDYTALLLMAKCLATMEKYSEAETYAAQAKVVYPQEPQAVFVEAICAMRTGKFDQAYAGFDAYERHLPGNPNTIFFRGYCREGAGRREQAAEFYKKYLQLVNQGDYAQHAYNKLVEWGHITTASAG